MSNSADLPEVGPVSYGIYYAVEGYDGAEARRRYEDGSTRAEPGRRRNPAECC